MIKILKYIATVELTTHIRLLVQCIIIQRTVRQFHHFYKLLVIMFDEQIEVFAQIPRIYTREQEEYQIMSEWSKTIQLKVVNFDLCAIICYAIWNTNNNRIKVKNVSFFWWVLRLCACRRIPLEFYFIGNGFTLDHQISTPKISVNNCWIWRILRYVRTLLHHQSVANSQLFFNVIAQLRIKVVNESHTLADTLVLVRWIKISDRETPNEK